MLFQLCFQIFVALRKLPILLIEIRFSQRHQLDIVLAEVLFPELDFAGIVFDTGPLFIERIFVVCIAHCFEGGDEY